MARPTGTRNPDYDRKRRKLALSLIPALAGQQRPSMRDLAATAGVGVSTLRHYFGDRSGAVAATLEELRIQGQPYLDRISTLRLGSIEQTLADMLHQIVDAWSIARLDLIHAIGLAEGLFDPVVGPVYIAQILEPTLAATESLLTGFMSEGALPRLDARVAALALVGPVVLALVHQRNLGGEGCRPLALHPFADLHLAGWLRGYGSSQAQMPLATETSAPTAQQAPG